MLHNYACENGHLAVVRVLISDFNADVNIASSMGTPLHYACKNGHVSVVRALVSEFKADPNSQKSHNRCTPLHYACENMHLDVARILILELKADPNRADKENSYTPLHIACRDGQLALVRLLLAGTKTNHSIHAERYSPLDLACIEEELGAQVLKFKGDPTLRDIKGRTALMIAIQNQHEDIALFLLQNCNASVNVKRNDGNTVLHDACYKCSPTLVHTLVHEYKADINAVNMNNHSPYDIAAKWNFETALFLLGEFSWDHTSIKNKASKLLHLICEKGNVDHVRTLIRKFYADVNAHDEHSRTPLHVAILAHNTV